MSRLIDLFAVLALAVVLLLPKASVEARPALEGKPVELDAVSRLQDDLFRHPDDLEVALLLGDAFLSNYRADWAIATLAPFVTREEKGTTLVDARLHLLLATARAERLESEAAVTEGQLVEKVCAEGEGTARCPAGTSARMQLISGAMQTLVDQHIDPHRDPARAKKEVFRVLHHSRPGY